MTEILLIRHGQSANNALPDHQRVCDPGLTDLGVRQAAATAEALADVSIAGLFCSPFLRSLETTRPIAEGRELLVKVKANIFEQGGCYSGHDAIGRRGAPGMGYGKLQRQYAGWHIDPAIPEAGWWGRDYENSSQAQDRAKNVVDWMTAELAPVSGIHVLVIHADFKYLLIQELLLRYAGTNRDITELNNVGITRFAWVDDRWNLTSLNSVSHLPADMIT